MDFTNSLNYLCGYIIQYGPLFERLSPNAFAQFKGNKKHYKHHYDFLITKLQAFNVIKEKKEFSVSNLINILLHSFHRAECAKLDEDSYKMILCLQKGCKIGDKNIYSYNNEKSAEILLEKIKQILLA
jgi:hypothetical protein